MSNRKQPESTNRAKTIDEQLRDMFAIHKEFFDEQERQARRRAKQLDSFASYINKSERGES